MTLNLGLAASLVGAFAGAVGAAAGWASERMQGRSKVVAWYLVAILVGSGFMGVMGSVLARLADHPRWANLASGASGALAAIAFGAAVGAVLRKSGKDAG